MDLKRPRICYFRGSYLNLFEIQYLEPLQEEFDLTVSCTRSHRFDISGISLPLIEVGCYDYLNGLIPRRINGRLVPNILKSLGYDEVLFGFDRITNNFDIIHIQEQVFYSSWQLARQKKVKKYKLVTVQCEVTPFWYMRRPGVANRAALVRQETDLFIARSERARSALICEGVERNKIRVIGHGVDMARFFPGMRDADFCKSLGISESRFIILFVGYLLWTKGIFALANAAKLLLQHASIKDLDPLFVMVGEGDERAAFESRIQLLGIERNVLLLGKQPYARLPDIHRMANVFVLPSISTRYISEQFGITLIESMATGVPVVSTHCGAIDEVIGDAGLLVQPNDSYRLYEALYDLCTDEALRKELSERGMSRIKANFSHNLISSKISSAYHEVLNR